MIFPDVSSFWVLHTVETCFSMENPVMVSREKGYNPLVASRCSPIVPYGNPQDGFMEKKPNGFMREKPEKTKNPLGGFHWFPLDFARSWQILRSTFLDVEVEAGMSRQLREERLVWGPRHCTESWGSQREIIIELPQKLS